MRIWISPAAAYKNGLQSLFRRLLGVETQILQINTLNPVTGQRQIALGSIKPFNGIIRLFTFRRQDCHESQSPVAGLPRN